MCGLQRQGLIAGLGITKGGQLRVNVWNATDEAIHLTAKTVMVNVVGAKLSVKYFGKEEQCIKERAGKVNWVCGVAKGMVTADYIKEKITKMFPSVGDLSSHPVNERMAKLEVRSSEVNWQEPPERGTRTQYAVESVADRNQVDKQLEEYVKRGYLARVSCGEDLYLSPLLPIRKPNGTFRFTNDFRKLNSYFPSKGTTQVDVWRKLWELKPEWKFYMKIDLKDGFFGIPVDLKLSRLFGFTYGSKRYRWVRLPQGWKWSSILFCERIAEILEGVFCPQYSDDVFVGAETPEELLEKAEEVFRRFHEFGVKVNFDKVEWLTTKIKFLGYEIENGQMTLNEYLIEKARDIGEVKTIRDMERAIGILSYARRCIVDVERILAPLRQDLKAMKKRKLDEVEMKAVRGRVVAAFGQALCNVRWLTLPGIEAEEFIFILESDWSGSHCGYLLFARKGKEVRLVDIGSRVVSHKMSSYLGELDAIKWACSRTKAYRGGVPLVIKTDNHGLVTRAQTGTVYDEDIRAYSRWAWIIANEPGFKLEFVPGLINQGADLLSRPGQKLNLPASALAGEGKVFKDDALPDELLSDDCDIDPLSTQVMVSHRIQAAFLKPVDKGRVFVAHGTLAGEEMRGAHVGTVRKGRRQKADVVHAVKLSHGKFGLRVQVRQAGGRRPWRIVSSNVPRLRESDIFEPVEHDEGWVDQVRLVSSVQAEDSENQSEGDSDQRDDNPSSPKMTWKEGLELIMEEHQQFHWGPYKVYHELQKLGIGAPFRIVKEVCRSCETCARFRSKMPKRDWGQPPFSLTPGHTIYADVVGPVVTGTGGFKYIHCIVDSATRMGDAMPLRSVRGAGIVKALERWKRRLGAISVLVTDNASYYASRVVRQWCEDNGVSHKFIAPYRHESVGLIERFQRTIVDRLRKIRYALGGSWVKHIPAAIEAMNFARHGVTKASPVELWDASEDVLRAAFEQTTTRRERRNAKRRVTYHNFYPGQTVLVYDEVAAMTRSDKFAPRWKGPYKLVGRTRGSYWKARKLPQGDAVSNEPGRKPSLVFHEDQLQPYDWAKPWYKDLVEKYSAGGS